MAGKKQQQQVTPPPALSVCPREAVLTRATQGNGPGRSASPFWRTSSGAAKSYDSKKVVGASYSHTDILRFDSL
ncbi:GTPase activating protein [Neofusicoccum parvum]|uniref:GTPase activating protein n=2 Tax=Neofusicoccum parvum TaxID=310453 RepID=A0ACB5S891_9PEZI|nr:putative gtpase-activating protein gyp1 protein [Neofusicoccum parvum UCRNP2]GME28963.1 GTPase activating protein [Neofusicoccum parvum]GME41411.1 GTPase activating protein [Neofusicoccum parvum]